ncbi:hypothetical protein GR160_02895 [Flavobacterium sp. Sd200]|uniref:hypothetical protein n=1 Tax=Flavobacterium sp. Sd200 TaxID=2692211 RepID=UPI001370E355|nr:hypothetical protein [Flavobacterium sp. Sd200]MXN90161.1 hypothetical protein [Flavobacterium sp. Sd200]
MKKYSIQEIMETLPVKDVAVIAGRKVRTKVLYIAGLAATMSPDGQIIEQSTKKEVGVTNFDAGNKLNAGRDLLVLGVRILFDTTAAVTVKTASWKSEAPANFKNGQLVINQQGSGDLFNNPIGPFAQYNAAIAVEDQFRAVSPFWIRQLSEFSIQFLLAGAGAADQAFRVELDCLEITDASVS